MDGEESENLGPRQMTETYNVWHRSGKEYMLSKRGVNIRKELTPGRPCLTGLYEHENSAR
jgi:hypothetical protein